MVENALCQRHAAVPWGGQGIYVKQVDFCTNNARICYLHPCIVYIRLYCNCVKYIWYVYGFAKRVRLGLYIKCHHGRKHANRSYSGKCGLLHHQYMWHIPYLLAKFETCSLFCSRNGDWTLPQPRSSSWYTDYTGNVARTVCSNVYDDVGSPPMLIVFIVLGSGLLHSLLSVISSAYDSWSSCSRQGRFRVTQKAAKLTCAYPINRPTSAMLLWHH